ncbi:hypothetical protein F2P56_000503 [Juglans regia]|uniref:Surfeit locus protein 2 n=1 Tax=Juglans regia TaxID=51240 RepID=A0A833YBU6_JUGRE|nr:hypothetical protein F2P56_000503 [Juglans regia]
MAKSEEKSSNKEGTNLLGAPTFTELDNGRFKCVETGHEVLVKDRESYSHSKRCRLGLIGFALSQNKPPLNMFKQDPLSRSKLICKLTGDTINKSEEHIWKHINGKRFLNKLEVKETEKLSSDGIVEEQGEQKPQKASKPSTDAAEDRVVSVEAVSFVVRSTRARSDGRPVEQTNQPEKRNETHKDVLEQFRGGTQLALALHFPQPESGRSDPKSILILEKLRALVAMQHIQLQTG